MTWVCGWIPLWMDGAALHLAGILKAHPAMLARLAGPWSGVCA
jgi:hypothetical protein